jgi:hypothetical protein
MTLLHFVQGQFQEWSSRAAKEGTFSLGGRLIMLAGARGGCGSHGPELLLST